MSSSSPCANCVPIPSLQTLKGAVIGGLLGAVGIILLQYCLFTFRSSVQSTVLSTPFDSGAHQLEYFGLHCNITGPCLPCLPFQMAEDYCLLTKYHQQLSCTPKKNEDLHIQPEKYTKLKSCLAPVAQNRHSFLVFEGFIVLVGLFSWYAVRKRKQQLTQIHLERMETITRKNNRKHLLEHNEHNNVILNMDNNSAGTIQNV